MSTPLKNAVSAFAAVTMFLGVAIVIMGGARSLVSILLALGGPTQAASAGAHGRIDIPND